jgi:hypothetical protein
MMTNIHRSSSDCLALTVLWTLSFVFGVETLVLKAVNKVGVSNSTQYGSTGSGNEI